MSKYKYNFYVSTGYVGSKISEDIDLVDDWNHSEDELDAMSEEELEELVGELYDEWLGNNINSGFERIE